MSDVLNEIRRVRDEAERLFDRADVEAALDRMACAITQRVGEANPLVITVLNGGVPFSGQLVTRLDFPLEMDCVQATRYGQETQGGALSWLVSPRTPLAGRVVLVLDDILDEGITLAAILAWCRAQGAHEVLSAVLVEKDLGHAKPCRADFVGLVAPNRYLFGYGMDYKGYWRNAPGIFALSV